MICITYQEFFLNCIDSAWLKMNLMRWTVIGYSLLQNFPCRWLSRRSNNIIKLNAWDGHLPTKPWHPHTTEQANIKTLHTPQSNQTLKKYTHQANAEEKTNAQAATIIIFFYQTATIPLDKKAPALTVCHMRLAFLVRIYSSHSQLERDRSEDVETGFSGQSIFLPLAPWNRSIWERGRHICSFW